MRHWLFWLLLLFTALLPYERFWDVLATEDSIFKPYRIVGLAALGLWTLWILSTGRRFRLDVGDKSYIVIFTWGILIALFWSQIYPNNLDYTGHGAQLTVFALAMYIFTKRLAPNPREIEWIFIAYIVGLIGSVAWAVNLGDSAGRFRGMQNNPNQLGISAGICFIFLLGQFVHKARAKLRWQVVRVGLAVAALAAIGMSGSRGAALGTSVGAAVILILALRRQGTTKSRHATRVPRVLAFALLCFVAGLASLDRFETAWETSDSRARFKEDYTVQTAGERYDLWRSGVNVGLEHFGLGAGMMQYLTHHVASMRELKDKSSTTLDRRPLGTHSDYVDLFASYGVIGIGAFVYYIRALYLALRRQLRHGDRDESDNYQLSLALGLLAAMLMWQVSQNSFAWCEYYMVMAIVHVVAFPTSRVTGAQRIAHEAPIRELEPQPRSAIGRNQALAHDRSHR